MWSVCRRTLDEAEREFDGTVLNLKAPHERLLRPKMNCADLMPLSNVEARTPKRIQEAPR
jgi:hypothetical protein